MPWGSGCSKQRPASVSARRRGASAFYAGLKLRFPERDGMHFLEAQAAEYDQRRAEVGDVKQFTFYVNDEKSSIQWLRQLLRDGPLRALPHFVWRTCERSYPGASTIARKSANLARPYSCRLMVFNRLTWPSTWPLLQDSSRAAATSA